MRQSFRRRFTQHILGTASRTILRVFGIRCEPLGVTPRGPALIAGNHLSWLDIVAVLASSRCTFVGKMEIRSWPIIGWLGHALGVVFVDRTRKRDLLRAIPALEQALRDGELVLLFPEGTTTAGHGILPFRSALFEAAVRAGAPVYPLILGGECTQHDIGNTPVICWLGQETLVANIKRLFAARGLVFSLDFGAPIAAGTDRKVLAARARGAIMQRFVPVQMHALIRTPPQAPARARSRSDVVTGALRRAAAAAVAPVLAIALVATRWLRPHGIRFNAVAEAELATDAQFRTRDLLIARDLFGKEFDA